jgi:biopolymer transport protein TolR
MAIQLQAQGKRRKRGAAVKPQMNVTPLVDVVLVLLIIFMVLVPLSEKLFSVSVPLKDEAEEPPLVAPDVPQVILSVRPGGEAFINQHRVADGELASKLRRVFAARGPDDQVLFFDADDQADFARALAVLDIARGAGIVTIAVLPERLARR